MMQSLEKMQERTRKQLRVTDWVIVLLTLSLMLGGAFFVRRARAQKGKEITVIYTIALLSVSEELAEERGGWNALMPIGASVTNQRGSLFLGEVESVSARRSLIVTVADREAVFLEQNGYADLYVRVRASALYRKGDCYRIGDLPILCGEVGDFRIGAYQAAGGRIVGIEEVTP